MTYVINRLIEIAFTAIICKVMLLLFDSNTYQKYLQFVVECILVLLFCQVITETVTGVMETPFPHLLNGSTVVSQILHGMQGGR